MGKRDEQRKLKLCVLGKIKEKKGTLFGAFSDALSKVDKIEAWKEINTYALSLGLIPPNKGWTYIRDVWWPNVRKSSTEKIDNFKKTGTGGGKDYKLNEVDEEVLNIIGKTSPVVAGLPVLKSLDDSHNIEDNEEVLPSCEIGNPLDEPLSAKVIETAKSTNSAGKKRKRSETNNNLMVEGASEKNNLQVKLLKLQIYKTQLEARKLEISMGLSPSVYTTNIERKDDLCIFDEEN